MEDMDLDLDIGSDPVKKFLLNKLKEIELSNTDLQLQIDRRKEMLTKCLEKVATGMNQNILEITDVWQKIFYGKWIIGIEVKSTGELRVAENVGVTLQWDSFSPFTYTTNCFCRFKQPLAKKQKLPKQLTTFTASMETGKIKKCDFLENEYIQTTSLNNNGVIIISFPMPEFIDRMRYHLSGIVTYEYKAKQVQLNIPTVEISIENLNHTVIDLKKYDLISGDEKSYLAMLSGSEATHLVVQYEVKGTSLEKRFEFECLFKKINYISKRKTSFYVDCLSELINNILIILEQHDDGIYDLNIYGGDQRVCQLLLHYIYKSIPNILILPRVHRNLLVRNRDLKILMNQIQSTSDPIFQDKLKNFIKYMEAQILLIEKYCNRKIDQIPIEDLKKTEEVKLKTHIDDYRKFRLELSNLEKLSDLQHQFISKLMENLDIPVEQD